MLYGASSRALWSISDMMMVQRVLELERKGMGTRAAIAEAERHIPNYRIPPKVLGSRVFAQALKDPSLTTFSRYHYGQWKSYAHMAKDLASAYKDPKQAFDAMGNVFATAVLLAVIGPQINKGLRWLTGDDKLELGPKGSMTIPSELWDMWRGAREPWQFVRNSITLAPIPSAGIDILKGGTDYFGRKIIEPGDLEKHRFGRVGAQVGEQAVQTLVPPYSKAAQGLEAKGKGGIAGIGKSLAEQGLGLRKTPEPYHGRTGGGTYAQQAARRHAHPRGPIEELEKWLEGRIPGGIGSIMHYGGV